MTAPFTPMFMEAGGSSRPSGVAAGGCRGMHSSGVSATPGIDPPSSKSIQPGLDGNDRHSPIVKGLPAPQPNHAASFEGV